jgi:hypothetical protein
MGAKLFWLDLRTWELGLDSYSSIAPHFSHCTEVRFASFVSGGFITVIVVNPPERKLVKRTSVHCIVSLSTILSVLALVWSTNWCIKHLPTTAILNKYIHTKKWGIGILDFVQAYLLRLTYHNDTAVPSRL